MSCGLCGDKTTKRMIAGISMCGNCFNRLSLLRSMDKATIDFYSDDANLKEATPRAKEYIKEILATKIVEAEALQENQKLQENLLQAKEMMNQARLLQLSQVKVTTGYNFENYKIIDYKDIVSGEIVLGTGIISEIGAQLGDILGTTASGYEGKLAKGKSAALQIIKNRAVNLGANAIIGVDFDIMTIGNNMIVVSANGTAVKIEEL